MNKKTLLCTTIAGTMLVAGLSMTKVKAVAEDALARVSSTDKMVVVELSNEKKELTEADIKALVEAKYAEKGATVTVTNVEKVTGELVGTGSIVTLSTGEKLTVVLYGDVNGDGKVSPQDLDKVAMSIIGEESDKLTGNGEKAGDIKGAAGVRISC